MLTLNFGANPVADASARYWVRTSIIRCPVPVNFGESGAPISDDNAAADMTGDVSVSSIQHTFNATTATFKAGAPQEPTLTSPAVAIGLTTGQYVKATGTIQRSTSNSVSFVAASSVRTKPPRSRHGDYHDAGSPRRRRPYRGEVWTINGGALLRSRTDTRWHANSPASMTGGTLGNVTISST